MGSPSRPARKKKDKDEDKKKKASKAVNCKGGSKRNKK